MASDRDWYDYFTDKSAVCSIHDTGNKIYIREGSMCGKCPINIQCALSSKPKKQLIENWIKNYRLKNMLEMYQS